MEDIFSFLPNLILNQEAVNQVIKCNEKTSQYSLVLSQKEAIELIETRNAALNNNGRIEFGGGVINKIITEFYDSPYLHQSNYANILNDLVETFYYFKNETMDIISDDELINLMRKYFDNNCRGSVELLQARELEQLARNIRYGISDYDSFDINDEEQIFYDEDDYE